ncbi:MAG: hypothetical protein HYT79_11095 [Elusimicrobia bacterium]|nr:hypothetical protein [Elusimicrobiota bacterium]
MPHYFRAGVVAYFFIFSVFTEAQEGKIPAAGSAAESEASRLLIKDAIRRSMAARQGRARSSPSVALENSPLAEGGTTVGVSRSAEITTFDFGDGQGPIPAHRHPNGDGWVADTASVALDAYLDQNTRVFGAARIRGAANIEGHARISGDHVLIEGNVHIAGNVRISDGVQIISRAGELDYSIIIAGDVSLFGQAVIAADASDRISIEAEDSGEGINISGDARIGDEAVANENISISGHVHISDRVKIKNRVRIDGEQILLAGDVEIRDRAQILDRAWIYGSAIIRDDAVVSGATRVHGQSREALRDTASVSGCAEIDDRAQIFERAQVTENAHVLGRTLVYEDARIAGHSWLATNSGTTRLRVAGQAVIAGYSLLEMLERGHRLHVSGNPVFGECTAIDDQLLEENGGRFTLGWMGADIRARSRRGRNSYEVSVNSGKWAMSCEEDSGLAEFLAAEAAGCRDRNIISCRHNESRGD